MEDTGAKALTLTEFERKYTGQLVRHARYLPRTATPGPWCSACPSPTGSHPRLLRALKPALT
ncbi:MAG: hypothetical protein WKG07_04715 [Hymenobacter sp.]